ncbi:hypothetical protein ACLI4Q_10860 [Natrialbaceae archaeon A-CW1-1]
MKLSWVHLAIIFLGLIFIIASIISGLAAVEYLIFHEESAEDVGDVSEEIDRYGMVQYEELSEEQKQIVDGAIEGEQYRFDDDDNEAIAWGNGRVISQDGQYHVIPRDTTINWISTAGLLALSLGIGGVLLIIEAIRRDHFPHYHPFTD